MTSHKLILIIELSQNVSHFLSLLILTMNNNSLSIKILRLSEVIINVNIGITKLNFTFCFTPLLLYLLKFTIIHIWIKCTHQNFFYRFLLYMCILRILRYFFFFIIWALKFINFPKMLSRFWRKFGLYIFLQDILI